MNKAKILKKKTGRIKKECIVLWAIILTLIILQAISAWYLVKLWNYQKQSSKQDLYALINNHEEKLYKHPVIDIAESRVYIPEVRAYLPLNEVTRNVRYYYVYTPGNKTLALSTSVGAQNESDDPACDRMVELGSTKKPQSSTYYDGGEIQPTKDGLRYISVHNKSTCSIYTGNTQDDLVMAAKSITEY